LVKTPLLNLACINIHPSLLPAYKGVDPVFYALLDNQQRLGVTLHKMAESFDTGDALLQQEIDSVADDGSLFSNNCRLFAIGADLAIRYLASEEAQDRDKVYLKDNSAVENKHYDSWPSVSDVSKLKQQGKYLVRLKQLWQELRNV
jgi:methionyl-tRNA formyltransferase